MIVTHQDIHEAARRVRGVAALALLVILSTTLRVAAAPEAAAGYRVVHGWPALPEGHILGQVSGVAVDSHNHVFVFHRANRGWGEQKNEQLIEPATVLCFEGASGKQVLAWGERKFVVPHGLRVDAEDNVWVTDVGLHQVFKFSHDGRLLMTLGTERVPGLDSTHFNEPTDVAIAPDGAVYVSDGYGNSRVARFSADGRFLADWGERGTGPGEFDTPHGITVDTQGRVYVADRSNARIQVFDRRGTFLAQWKGAELGRPWAVTSGPDGLVYVVDGGDQPQVPPDRGRVHRLNADGKILETWGSFGNYDGQINWGHTVAVGKDGAVYVGDIRGMRVQKFVRTGNAPSSR